MMFILPALLLEAKNKLNKTLIGTVCDSHDVSLIILLFITVYGVVTQIMQIY